MYSSKSLGDVVLLIVNHIILVIDMNTKLIRALASIAMWKILLHVSITDKSDYFAGLIHAKMSNKIVATILHMI